jgi:vacuolar-type H+-ATPase subunit B/Vma2
MNEGYAGKGLKYHSGEGEKIIRQHRVPGGVKFFVRVIGKMGAEHKERYSNSRSEEYGGAYDMQRFYK